MPRATCRWGWAVVGLCLVAAACSRDSDPPGSIAPTVRSFDAAARDQDDMAIWVAPGDPSRSTVIAADKAAGKLFVYDLTGQTMQTVEVEHPGNIDLRYGFLLGGREVDLVAVNEIKLRRVFVYAIDPATRQLTRVDNGVIRTGANYGGTLYRSGKTGKLYFIATSATDGVEQFELVDDDQGKIAGRKVRAWKLGKCEGGVADDQYGRLYIAEEDRGIWEVGAEPDDPTPGELILPVGQHGLVADLEGLAIYPFLDGNGYLLVSNQGASDFRVFERTGEHRLLGSFTVRGARATDGIEVCPMNLGENFPQGLFVCHTDRDGRPVLLVPWQNIAAAFDPALRVESDWSFEMQAFQPADGPRTGHGSKAR